MRLRRLASLVALTAAATVAAPAAAGAACSLTLIVVPCLQATWPTATVSFGSVNAGTTTTSAEQLITVSANVSWGIKVSADQVGGRPREWNGSSYVASSPKILTNPLQWARTSIDGTPTASPVYTDLSTTAANVLTGRGATGCVIGLLCGFDDIGVRLRLRTTFSDRRASPNLYRLLVTYDAQTGF